jgi:hypothetical protein
MRLKLFCLFLTFVLVATSAIQVMAAANKEILNPSLNKSKSGQKSMKKFESESKPSSLKVKNNSENLDIKNSLRVSEPPAVQPSAHFEVQNRFNSSRLYTGLGTGLYQETVPKESLWTLGYQRPFGDFLGSWDWSVSTVGFKYFGGELSFKSFVSTWSDFYRPYGRIGLQANFIPSDFIANFIHSKRYFIRGAVGLYNFANSKDRFGLEAAAAVGLSGSHLELLIFFPTPF